MHEYSIYDVGNRAWWCTPVINTFRGQRKGRRFKASLGYMETSRSARDAWEGHFYFYTCFYIHKNIYVWMSIYVKVHETSFILQTCSVCALSSEPTRRFEEGAKNTAVANKGSSRGWEDSRHRGPVGESLRRSCNRKDTEPCSAGRASSCWSDKGGRLCGRRVAAEPTILNDIHTSLTGSREKLC